MGLFDVTITEEQLRAYYARALVEAGFGFVDPGKYPYLDRAVRLYAQQHGCSYDSAFIYAMSGKKTGKLAE